MNFINNSTQHMQNILSLLLSSLSVEQSLKIIFDYLKNFIPATRMLLVVVDRKNFRFIPISEWVKYPELSFQYTKISNLGFNNISNIQTDNDILIYKDMSNNMKYKKYFLDIGLIQKSVLSLFLHRDDNYFIACYMDSPIANAFKKEHSKLMLTVKPILQLIVNRLSILNLDNSIDPNQVNKFFSSKELLEKCSSLNNLLQELEIVSKTKKNILIYGETGVGKELVAETIHGFSNKSLGPLVKVNCGVLTDSLQQSLLFGHEKGSFTGAIQNHNGYFEQANNGTIFLDEIAELNLVSQVQLLRVLETGEIQKIGSNKLKRLDFRVIAATNKNLEELVVQGKFREDLWYRLNEYFVEIPPLRQRREDIPVLIQHFYLLNIEELKFKIHPKITSETVTDLSLRYWKGNIRELKNSIGKAMTKTFINKQKTVDFDDETSSSQAILKNIAGEKCFDIVQDQENYNLNNTTKQHIQFVLNKCNGKIQGKNGAAELLGINYNTLRAKMSKLGIVYKKK